MSVKVGVIGAGNWGKNVVRTFHALGALGAVAEANPALHDGLSYTGVPVYTDYRDLLRSPLPAVAIATPVFSHHAIARAALLAGKDVLVEKPLTLSVAEAADLVALARERGRILMVGHLLLFQPAVQWMKAYLEGGALGRLYSLHQERLNLGTARSVENALWSLGVHDVAVLLYLTGEAPVRVEATGQKALQPSIEDDVYLHMHFDGGVQAHLHTSWLWPEKRRRLTVVCEHGMLVFDELAQTVTLHRKKIAADLRSDDAGSEVVFQGGGEPLMREAEHFLAGVAAQQRSDLVDGEHGLAVVRILEAAGKEERVHASAPAGPEPADSQPGA